LKEENIRHVKQREGERGRIFTGVASQSPDQKAGEPNIVAGAIVVVKASSKVCDCWILQGLHHVRWEVAIIVCATPVAIVAVTAIAKSICHTKVCVPAISASTTNTTR